MRIIYAEEKLTKAVEVLATGSGRVKERLRNAAASLVCLRPDGFPDGDLRRTFVGVIDDLTYQQGGENEGSISATLKITDDKDARAIARRIIDLHHAVRRHILDQS